MGSGAERTIDTIDFFAGWDDGVRGKAVDEKNAL